MHEQKGNDVCLLLCKDIIGKLFVLKVFEQPQAAVSCHSLNKAKKFNILR